MVAVGVLATATEYACGLLVLVAFFPWRIRGKLRSAAAPFICGLVHILFSVLTTAWPLLPRVILILANFYLVSSACFQGNLGKRFLTILFYWASVYELDLSVLTLSVAMSNQPARTVLSQEANYLFCVLCSRFLLLAVSLGCRYLARRPKRKGRGRLWTVLFLIPPLCTIVGTGALVHSAMAGGTLPVGIVALSGGGLCVNVILCFGIHQLERNQLMEQENQNLPSEAARNLELAKTYRDSFTQQRKITHEFRNQLDTVGNLLDREEYDRAASYVQHLRCSIQEIVPCIHTNHPVVDAVLNQKYQQAAQKGIGMLLSCNDLAAIPLEDGDLVTLLGNILDNAISASAQTAEKQIWVRLWQEQGVYRLVVRNDCPEIPATRRAQEVILHGYGMSLVHTVLEKYAYPYYAEKVGSESVFSAILG